jgi:peptidoglycan/xylan/chitin deacetylase (PgdA/CDA1 family)
MARGVAALGLALMVSCRAVVQAPLAAEPGEAPTVRFLLTFDDGPSIKQPFNPTLRIMEQLATNDIQPGIKAIFFVQTGHPRGGGTLQGREMMRRMHEEGHLLGLHSVSPRGHIDHTQVSTNELVPSLAGAMEILRDITGAPPLFVRPPFGAYNLTTRCLYRELGLHLLMADIPARDGVIYGYNGSLRRRRHIRQELEVLYRKAQAPGAALEPVDVVLNFHDVNPYTARHMTEYLHILVEEAHRVGFQVPVHPFLNSRTAITDVALCRCVVNPAVSQEIPAMVAAQPVSLTVGSRPSGSP